MEYLVEASTQIEAGHQVDLRGCDRPHGHHYDIYVTVASKVDAKTALDLGLALEDQLAKLTHEIDRARLEDMIAPASPTYVGLASFVWARLVPLFETLREVTVDESTGRSITVRSDSRL